MCANIVKCSIVVTLIVQSICTTEIKNSKLLYSEQEIGECDVLIATKSSRSINALSNYERGFN